MKKKIGLMVVLLFIPFLLFLFADENNGKDYQIEWKKIIDGTQYDSAEVIRELDDGSLILGTTLESTELVQTEKPGKRDWGLIKLNKNGEIQWKKVFGGAGSDCFVDLIKAKNGGYIFLGQTNSSFSDFPSIGNYDIWIGQLDSDFNWEWEKRYGGKGREIVESIQQTEDGGFIITGASNSNSRDFRGNHGKDDCFVIKLDQNGNKEWSRLYGGSKEDEGVAIIEKKNTVVVFANTYSSDKDIVDKQNEKVHLWLLMLDKQTGHIIQSRTYGNNHGQGISSLAETEDGGFFLGGFTSENIEQYQEDIWIVKMDGKFNIQWQKTLRGTSRDLIGDLTISQNGNYTLAAMSYSKEGVFDKNLGSWDFWIIELNKIGEIVRKQHIGGDGYDHPLMINSTSDGDLIISGITSSLNGDFEGENDTFNILVLKLHPNGKTQETEKERVEALHTISKKPVMVYVKGGTFAMGKTNPTTRLIRKALPVHEVTLNYDYFIGKYEVTFEEYDRYCDALLLPKAKDANSGRGKNPVININWNEAVKFCNWLSEYHQLPKAYDNYGNLLDVNGQATSDITQVKGYRLPTEAEWEFAARGGLHAKMDYTYAGSNNIFEVAWFDANSEIKPHKVGVKEPNDLQIYDLSGNVWEWCHDFFRTYDDSKETNPVNTKLKQTDQERELKRVIRGGSYKNGAIYSRIPIREYFLQKAESEKIGFRLARSK